MPILDGLFLMSSTSTSTPYQHKGGFICFYFLKAKSKVYSIFHNFKTQVELYHNHKLKTLRTNYGGEFHSLTSTLHIFGVVHQLLCPHTLEQNGFVEGKCRHIVEKGLTLFA